MQTISISLLAAPVILVGLSVVIGIFAAVNNMFNTGQKLGSNLTTHAAASTCKDAAQGLQYDYQGLRRAYSDVKPKWNTNGKLVALRFDSNYSTDLQAAAIAEYAFAEEYYLAAEANAVKGVWTGQQLGTYMKTLF